MKNNNTINEVLFCNPLDVREFCKAPFIFNGQTVACDGHSVLFTKHNANYPLSEYDSFNKGLVEIEGYFDLQGVVFEQMDEVIFPDKIKCFKCRGYGKCATKACSECDGQGEVDLSNDYNSYSVTCKSCDGDGLEFDNDTDVNCYVCHGSRVAYGQYEMAKINGANIYYNDIAKINDVSGVQVCYVEDKYRFLFKGDGFKGFFSGRRG